MYDVIIVGGGPAGLTAAIYACRGGKKTLVLEKAGFGGQIALSPRVENYPGFESISGEALAEKLLSHAMALGAETDLVTVTGLKKEDGYWKVFGDFGEEFESRNVIVAAGAKHRSLGLPGEEELVGCGVSYCAVCDGGFYAGKETAVAGGGDSALQEALLLSDICSRVYLIHRRGEFRAETALQQRVAAKENITCLMDTRIRELVSENGELTGLRLEQGGEEKLLSVPALFVAVGMEPDLEAFREYLPLTAQGYADLDEGCAAGAGLYAAGDCRKKTVRQVATAVADGAMAAASACKA